MLESTMYESDNNIAAAYGFPFLFETESINIEDPDITVKRIVVMNAKVVQWIADHRRIPSSNPNASPAERQIAHWLRVCEFYANSAVDHAADHQEEMDSNNMCHKICRYVIRHGHFPEEQ
jgi:hypothetical protein